MTITSEDQLLAIIDRNFSREHGNLLLGRGDDCAELKAGTELALSTDLFFEDVHFRRSYFLPEEIGYKALAVNLSDLAAAGAVPAGFSLGLICAPGLDENWYEAMFRGMAELVKKYDIPLSGGDISLGDKLGFSLTVWGTPAEGKLPFLRRRASPGDYIFIVGPAGGHCSLGLARNGLKHLEEQGRGVQAQYPESCRALLHPQPQLEGGIALALVASLHGNAVGLMDLSDGLLRDLPRLLGRYGAELYFSTSILHPELGEKALEAALAGGDDYLLLGACPAPVLSQIMDVMKQAGLRLDVLGEVLPEGCGMLRGGKAVEDIVEAQSFDHFSSK